MKYRFLHHTLDTKTSELSSSNGNTLLKQKPFLLLLCLVKNPQQILSKDFLLKEVWDDRLISDNTIAQTVAQLRQLLNDDGKNPEHIITHRGRGISFTPEVILLPGENVEINQPQINRSQSFWLVPAALLLLIAVVGYFWQQSKSPTTQNDSSTLPPNLLVYADSNNKPSDDWLKTSAPQLVADFLGTQYKGKISTTLLTSETTVNDYLDQQFQINPELKVIHTTLIQQNADFILNLDLTNNNQIIQSQQFTGDSISAVLTAATSWLNDRLQTSAPELITHLPEDPQVLELYMRGMAANNDSDYEKAAQYFNLALTEQPSFHWSRLQLADMYKILGNNEDALVLLDTLEGLDLYPQIALKAIEIRGYIYELQGHHEQAKQLFEQTLKKYQQLPAHRINPIRFELSHVLTSLNKLNQALVQLKLIEQTTTLASDPQLYADTLHKTASIYQSLGKPQSAESYANTAIDTYLKLQQPLGAAKVHSLLARVYTFKSEYEQAKFHLNESLRITKNLDYKLGVGATINELIYLLLREGDFNQAEKLIGEMQDIAIELGYSQMLIAAKQHAVTLEMGRRNWSMAEQYLQQLLELATNSNSQASLMTSQFLNLELHINQDLITGTQDLLDWLEQRIDPTKNPRQYVAMELRRAQIMLLKNQQQAAIDLLNKVKGLATETQDHQSLIEANNILAKIYLKQQPAKALEIINENKPLNPVAYPYLLILSKALQANKQPEMSLQAAIACKNSAGQRWQREDEAYLSQLKLLSN